MFPLFETIRIQDYKARQLSYHQQRMQESARVLWNGTAPDAEKILRDYSLPGPGVFKCRLEYSPENHRIQFTPYTIRPVRTLQFLDAGFLDYPLKYTDRTALDRLLAGCKPGEDVLLTKNGLITDTLYANVALLRGNTWVTPAIPLLKGTMRQFLIDTGILTETEIHVNNLYSCEKIRLVNAMMPWGEGPEIDMVQVRR